MQTDIVVMAERLGIQAWVERPAVWPGDDPPAKDECLDPPEYRMAGKGSCHVLPYGEIVERIRGQVAAEFPGMPSHEVEILTRHRLKDDPEAVECREKWRRLPRRVREGLTRKANANWRSRS